MLKINKILSKKIKFPLSLRGAKRRSNLSGFSLIELMIAAAILAMAILGIFRAYSTGFMGMAEARDRTVATNYAREAMEDIKNMDFEAIATQPRVFISGTEFEREVIVQESTNLKKVTTNIYWEDREGITKMLKTDMVVYFIETTAGAATRIILIADLYNILTEGTSAITAVIKDAKGNTVTTYNVDISFSITMGSGNLLSSPVSPNQGIATTTFTASTDKGDVTIEASSGDLTSDTVTIKVTDPEEPVKINLDATKKFMTASVSSTSEITATIVNAGGATITEATNEITFSVTGPGTLSPPTTIPASSGVVTITLTATTTPGTITITASATGLEPGVVDVITGGQISLSASKTFVPEGEKSEITVTTKDVNGVPINYIGTINLSVVIPEGSLGYGDLSTNTLNFTGSTSSETVTFTAFSEGEVEVTADDQVDILTSANPITLNITSVLVPDHIEVYANPSSIQAGGTDTSTITARVKTADNITITSYAEPITFETTSGSFSSSDPALNSIILISGSDNYKGGIATVELYPPETAGIATITVSSTPLSGSLDNVTVDVGIYIDPVYIQLIADPQHIKVIGENPDTCIITATIKDEGGHTVSDYKGKVKFSIVSGDAEFAVKGKALVTVVNGEAQILLKSGNFPGTVKVNATSSYKNKDGVKIDIEGTLNIPVGITLILADPPNIDYSSELYYVSLDIDIQGAGLILEEMQVSWDPSEVETLNEIEIKSPYTADPADKVFDGSTDPASSGDIIDVDDIILSTEISNVKIYFNQDVSGKTITVIFNPNSGNYSVPVPVPAI